MTDCSIAPAAWRRAFAPVSVAAALVTASACSDAGGPRDEPRLQPVRIVEAIDIAPRQEIVAAARQFVLSQTIAGDLTAVDDFALLDSVLGADGLHHVRFQQTHQGIPVWGADVVVHASPDAILAANGTIATGLPALVVSPSVSSETALAAAKAAYAARATEPAPALAYDRETARLVIYPSEQHGFRAAWHVVFYTELQAGIEPGLWNHVIDAATGDALATFNAIHTLSQGSGPGGNAKVPRTWVDALDVEDAAGGLFQMSTARLQTIDLMGSTTGGTVVAGPLDAVGDAAENDAHGFAEATLNFMSEWYGYESIDDAGFVIRSRVHYGINYENAFWNGVEMTYGDGASFFYPLSGDADVVAHEINHGFTSFHSNLTYAGQSGGINESFSDVAGVAVDFFLDGDDGDWLIGADIFRNPDPNTALRYMCDPPQDGASIDHASDYTPGMDVHYSSGVFNKAFCLAARRLGSGSPTGPATQASVRRAGQAWYLANEAYWTAGTTFTQGCQGVLDAAGALAFEPGEIAALAASFADVGVVCDAPEPSCGDGTCSGGESCASCPGDCGVCAECGDGTCADGESCESCPGDCGACTACDHDMCVEGAALDASCDDCVTAICDVDSYCCNVEWDGICVGEVASVCGLSCDADACGDGVCGAGEDCGSCSVDCGACSECDHDLCVEGGALEPACDDCAAAICDVDPYCCNNQWDDICVDEVASVCGLSCDDDACGDGVCGAGEDCGSCSADCGSCGECEHGLCAKGDALDAACDPCAAAICDVDWYCCSVAWDAICVGEVASVCGQTCE